MDISLCVHEAMFLKGKLHVKREHSESAIFHSWKGKSLFLDKEKPWSERVSVHGKATN
jgi:hypothetical protein